MPYGYDRNPYQRSFPRAPLVSPRLTGTAGRLSGRVAAGAPRPSAGGEDGGYDESWAYGPNGQFSGNQLQQNLVMAGGRGGIWDPTGSKPTISAIRRMLLQRRGDRMSRARLGAEAMGGNDPYLRNYARIEAGAGADDEHERALSDAILQSIMANQQRLGGLTQGYFGQAINRQDAQKPNPLAQAGGQLAGVALGAATGGLSRAGSDANVPRMGDPDFIYPRY